MTRNLRLETKPAQSLYKWAINEVDAKGQIGEDQIPWPWTLRFTATSCSLLDSINFKSKDDQAAPKGVQGQVIRAALRPGSPRDDAIFERQTKFSMFGTDRVIDCFDLEIHPIAENEVEGCSAWGSVSYTSEIDFRRETTADCVQFYMYVTPETFARYAAQIAHGLVTDMTLIVGSVAGFYSAWSPSISTRNVKVLTIGSEQKVNLPGGIQFDPPRLGEIGTVELHINHTIEFTKPGAQGFAESSADVQATLVALEATPRAPVDPRTLQLLRSLRRTAWFAVFLLALIFVATLMRQ